MTNYSVHPSAVVDEGAKIGAGTKIWHFAHVCSDAIIGENCSFGQNHNGGFMECTVGNNVVQAIQTMFQSIPERLLKTMSSLARPVCCTNVSNPRSQVSRQSLYEETRIRRGATIGANATIVCGTTIGRYAFISAGAVVTKDVLDYSMILGVPGKQRGWMSRHGHPLREKNELGEFVCPESGFRYAEEDGKLICLDLDEEEPLPTELSVGKTPMLRYRDLDNQWILLSIVMTIINKLANWEARIGIVGLG